MAHRARLPYSAYHDVALPRRLRKQIKRRSNRYARKVYQPQIQALRKQKKSVKRQYAKQLSQATQSNRQAINASQQALSGIPLSGLQGKYRQEVKQEIASSQADVAASLPSLNAESRQPILENRASDLSAIRQDIVGARVDAAQTAAREAYQLTKSARTTAASKLKAQHKNAVQRRQNQRQRQKDKGQTTKEHQQALNAAIQAGINLLSAYPGHAPDNSREWERFTHSLLQSEGVSKPQVAQHAAHVIRTRLRDSLHTGGVWGKLYDRLYLNPPDRSRARARGRRHKQKVG